MSYTLKEINIIKSAAKISTEILYALKEEVQVDADGEYIDRLAAKLCKKNNVLPAFKGVKGDKMPFPGNVCLSVNEEVLHTIPKKDQKFQKGDLISIDFGIFYKGFFTDHCITVGLKELNDNDEKLINIGKLAVDTAVSRLKPGVFTGDIGNTMQSIIEMANFSVVKKYIGHGIGKSLWQRPEIPAFGKPKTGEKFVQNQVVCIEAQTIADKSDKTYTRENGWDIVSQNHKRSVMFEYMVLLTKSGHEILTKTKDWALII